MASISQAVFLLLLMYLVSGIHYLPGCKTSFHGEEYSGTASKTISGLTCQRWDTQSPHRHTFDKKFSPGTVSAQENYCRNPDRALTEPWCYTTDPDVRWEYCDVTEGRRDVVIRDHLGRTCEMITENQKALYGYNDKMKHNTTPEDCQRLCVEEVEFECLSAEYNNLTKKCFLSHKSRDTNPEAMGRHTFMTYYHKICIYNMTDNTKQEVRGSSCSDRYIPFKQGCYKFTTFRRTWTQAFENCSAEGGHLVSIESQDEFEFILDQIEAYMKNHRALRTSGWWTSGKRGADHHTWYWINDDTAAPTPLSWAQWWPGEPNDYRGIEDYINIYYESDKQGFNDVREYNTLRYICEREN